MCSTDRSFAGICLFKQYAPLRTTAVLLNINFSVVDHLFSRTCLSTSSVWLALQQYIPSWVGPFLLQIVQDNRSLTLLPMSTSQPGNSLTGTGITPVNTSYTALTATLVLLLVVSSAIVVRSLFLRRRRRRLIEETIQAGTGTWSPTNNPNRRRRRNIGEKPKVWEAWVQQADEKGGDNDIMAWDDILASYTHSIHPKN